MGKGDFAYSAAGRCVREGVEDCAAGAEESGLALLFVSRARLTPATSADGISGRQRQESEMAMDASSTTDRSMRSTAG